MQNTWKENSHEPVILLNECLLKLQLQQLQYENCGKAVGVQKERLR